MTRPRSPHWRMLASWSVCLLPAVVVIVLLALGAL
jgi:hypothetical protein